MMAASDEQERKVLIPFELSSQQNHGDEEESLVSVSIQSRMSSRAGDGDAMFQKEKERYSKSSSNNDIGSVLQRFSDENLVALERVFHANRSVKQEGTNRMRDIFQVLDLRMAVLDDWAFGGMMMISSSSENIESDPGEELLTRGIAVLLRDLERVQTGWNHVWSTADERVEEACSLTKATIRLANALGGTWLVQVAEQYPHLEWNDESNSQTFKQKVRKVAATFKKHAKLAAQEKIPRCTIQAVRAQQKHRNRLFGVDWEERYVNNEVMQTIVNTLNDSMSHVKRTFADESWYYHAFLGALVKGMVGYYLQELAYKASHLQRKRFSRPSRALQRIRKDVQLLQSCFKLAVAEEKQNENYEDLNRMVVDELNNLNIVCEFLNLVVVQEDDLWSSVEDFILIFHQKLGANVDVTRLFMTDLWILMSPRDRKQIQAKIQYMMDDLEMVSERMKEQQEILDYEKSMNAPSDGTSQATTPTTLAKRTGGTTTAIPLSLDNMLKAIYEDLIWQEHIGICSALCLSNGIL